MGKVTAQEKKNFSKNEALYSCTRNDEVCRDQKTSFDSIKKYIQSCSAVNDPHSRIIIENDGIYFGHGLMEIQASFPSLPGFIIRRINKSFSEENIQDYTNFFSDSDFNLLKPINKQQKALVEEAKLYMNSIEKKILPKKSLNQLMDPQEVLFDLIENNNTVAIGELHEHKSSKKLLIDNMSQLKEKGIGVIYLEHVFYDTQKELLDFYFESDSLLMPEMLKNYLEWLDRGFHLSSSEEISPYTFTGLVIQAKRYGIKIIPVDTVASYSTGSILSLGDNKDPANRCLMMNYVAAKSYNERRSLHEKSIFLIGSVHINAVNSGIPGIAEITKGSTLVVEDLNSNTKKLTAENHPVKPDAIIYMTTQLSKEANDLSEIYKRELAQQEEETRQQAEIEVLKKKKAQRLVQRHVLWIMHRRISLIPRRFCNQPTDVASVRLSANLWADGVPLADTGRGSPFQALPALCQRGPASSDCCTDEESCRR
jgi:hypothetical protein